MIGFRKLLASTILALGASGVSSAATYFVTQSGAGSQNGSSSTNAWSVATYNASSSPQGGDTVSFSGTITSTVKPNTSGSGNGATRLTLDFSAATLATADPRISLNGKNYLNLTGGTFATASSGNLINFNSSQSHDVTIANWTHTGSSTSTAHVIAGYYCYNLVVSNNTIDNVAGLIMGDSILNHDILIQNNYVRTSLNTTDQTDIVFYGDAYNMTIEGNKFIQRTEGATSGRHNDIIQTYQKGGSNAGNPRNWVVRYNWFQLDVATGSGDNSFMMMENMSGDPALKIYGNVFIGTGQIANNGICINSNNSDAVFYFYNNTIIRKNSPDNTIRFLSPGKLLARNNAGEADSGESGTFLSWTMTAAADWNRNFFYLFDGCTATYSGANGSCGVDPKFVDYANNNFALQSSSSLIGAADNSVGAEYSQGIASGAQWPNPALVARGTAWDVGAFQSTSGGGGVLPPVPPTSLTTSVR